MAERGTQSLARSSRLRKRRQFLAVQSSGRRHHTANFLVFVQAQPSALSVARLGVTVSKKVGGAVVRNRVKRLVREVFRRCQMFFPRGLDVVFVAKRSAAQAEYEQVRQEIEALCRRAFAS